MKKREGLRAPPTGWPGWLRTARAYLGGLRRKDLQTYRGIRGRVCENWRDLAPAWERIAAAYEQAQGRGWRRYGTRDDAGTLCALVFECVAWWAAEERHAVAPVRDAAARLLVLQDDMARAVEDLCTAAAESESLCLRHGLEIDAPLWVNDLDAALRELSHRFPVWAEQQPVRTMIERERQEGATDRPRVSDLLQAACSAGVLQGGVANPIRRIDTGEWLRTVAPTVRPLDAGAADALRVSSGSGPKSERAQLRQLFATLQELAEDNGAADGTAGPLEWLTPADLSRLCCAAVGDGKPTTAHPWGGPAKGFDPEKVREARGAYLSSDRADRKAY